MVTLAMYTPGSMLVVFHFHSEIWLPLYDTFICVDVIKCPAKVGMGIAKVGGPTYKIGMNGGSASSRVSSEGGIKLNSNPL